MKAFSFSLFFCLVSLLWTTGCQSTSGVIEPVSPRQLGFSPQKLARIDSLAQYQVDHDQLPAAAALVVRRGKLAYFKTFGSPSLESDASLPSDAIFRLASMTKPVTVVAALLLMQEGQIQLNDPVANYLPAFGQVQVLDSLFEDGYFTTHPARITLALRHLFTHTAGFGYGFADSVAAQIYGPAGVVDGFTLEPLTLAQNIDRLAKVPLLHEPGDRWTYGLSIDVLGRVVEVVSGKSLEDFCQERIFDPLGMKDTHFTLPEQKYERLLPLYGMFDGQTLQAYPAAGPQALVRIYPTEGAQTYHSPGAGLLSTAMDMAKFGQMLANGGVYNGRRILRPELIRLMSTNQLARKLPGRDTFGLGVFVNEASPDAARPELPGPFGWSGLFSTYFWIDPSEELVGIWLSQVYPNPFVGLPYKFQKRVYEAME